MPTTVNVNGVRFHTVPKVAGTSIKSAFLQWQGINVKNKADVHSHPALNDGGTTPTFICGVIREPVDRIISGWANKTLYPTPRLETLGWEKGKSLNEWYKLIRQNPNADHHFRPQHTFFGKGTRLWKYENLDELWRILMDQYGLPPLEHFNKSEKRMNTFTDHQMKNIQRIYEKDFELHNRAL